MKGCPRVHMASVNEAHLRRRPTDSGYAKPECRPRQNSAAEKSSGQHACFRSSTHASVDAAERASELKLVAADAYGDQEKTHKARKAMTEPAVAVKGSQVGCVKAATKIARRTRRCVWQPRNVKGLF